MCNLFLRACGPLQHFAQHSLHVLSASISPACRIRLKYSADFIAHAAEDSHLLRFSTGGMGGIIKWEMMPIDLTWENGAGLVGIATHGDHRFHLAVKKFVQVLGVMARGIKPDFLQTAKGQRMHKARWLGPRTGHLIPTAQGLSQDCFS